MSKKIYIYLGILIAVSLITGVLIFSKNSFDITKSGALIGKANTENIGMITGTECSDASTRPVAVMISSDPEARPLSGVGEADVVFEMPVTPNGVTRMMAVYQCGRPKEIGSVRSSRLDFVPLALGLDTIYAHFGGEHTVLEELNSGIINNIDGLKYDGTIYYRKDNIPRPHNAFTNFDLLNQIIGRLGYSQEPDFDGYLHDKNNKSAGTIEPSSSYSGTFLVNWRYGASSNSYLRSRSGSSEIDKNTNKQVEVKNVVVMETTWSPISKDYVRIKTVGSGKATVYRNGQAVTGTWEKKADKSKLFFYDQDHKEIKFTPGQIWVEITTQF